MKSTIVYLLKDSKEPIDHTRQQMIVSKNDGNDLRIQFQPKHLEFTLTPKILKAFKRQKSAVIIERGIKGPEDVNKTVIRTIITKEKRKGKAIHGWKESDTFKRSRWRL